MLPDGWVTAAQPLSCLCCHPVVTPTVPCLQMVWEHGCTVIVMLSPLAEDSVKQCDRYWPDEGSSLYHIYEASVASSLGQGAPSSSCSPKHSPLHSADAHRCPLSGR